MTEDPTGDQLPRSRPSTRTASALDPNPPNTYYFFMNETHPAVRQARGAGGGELRDRQQRAAAHLRRPPRAGLHLPAAGLRSATRSTTCPYGDPERAGRHREGQAARGEVGHRRARRVTVWTNNKDPRPAIADYYARRPERDRLQGEVKILDQQVYFGTVGQKKTKAQIGFTDWYQDFPHPADFFEPNLSWGGARVLTHVQLRVQERPEDRQGARGAHPQQDPTEVADKWAELDGRRDRGRPTLRAVRL